VTCEPRKKRVSTPCGRQKKRRSLRQGSFSTWQRRLDEPERSATCSKNQDDQSVSDLQTGDEAHEAKKQLVDMGKELRRAREINDQLREHVSKGITALRRGKTTHDNAARQLKDKDEELKEVRANAIGAASTADTIIKQLRVDIAALEQLLGGTMQSLSESEGFGMHTPARMSVYSRGVRALAVDRQNFLGSHLNWCLSSLLKCRQCRIPFNFGGGHGVSPELVIECIECKCLHTRTYINPKKSKTR
jgi:hypothetical protein